MVAFADLILLDDPGNPHATVLRCYRLDGDQTNSDPMRTITTLLLTNVLVVGATAQTLGYYDISPNWTATDINGTTHTLYDYLDDGYTVIIDMSTTWCPPCAALHWSRGLDSLYEHHGPGTADHNIMVFLVECDPSTDMADLDGSSIGTPDGNTLGDWITGTHYPIIDDAAIGELYGVPGFPTVLCICPSRMIASFTYIFGGEASFLEQSQACAHHEADSPHDATLLGDLGTHYCEGPEVTLRTQLYNVGTAPLTAATIEAVSVYDSLVVGTVEWTGELATYASEEIVFPAWSAPSGERQVAFRLTTPDDDHANDSTWGEYGTVNSFISSATSVTFELMTDDNGSGVEWYVVAFPGGPTVFQAPTGTYGNNALYDEVLDLEPDVCYLLQVVYHVEGGFQDPAYFRMLTGTDVLVDDAQCYLGSGSGASFYRAYFSVQSGVGIGDVTIMTAGIALAPNPATDHIELRLASVGSGSNELVIRDAMGRAALKRPVTGTNTSIDLSALNNGVYLFTITGEYGTRTRRVVVSR